MAWDSPDQPWNDPEPRKRAPKYTAPMIAMLRNIAAGRRPSEGLGEQAARSSYNTNLALYRRGALVNGDKLTDEGRRALAEAGDAVEQAR